MIPLRRIALLNLLAALPLAGCANQKHADQQSKQNQPPPQDAQLASADASNRIRDIQARVTAFDAASRQLPGETDQENRRLMQQSFSNLGQILTEIAGESPSSEFRQGMRVLDASRQQLAHGSADLTAEPTIGQGLRAAARLLVNLNNLVFASDPEIGKRIDAVQQRLDQLDTTHGGMNRVVAAQAVRDTAGVLQQMSAAMADRAGLEGGKPTTRPSTGGAAAVQ